MRHRKRYKKAHNATRTQDVKAEADAKHAEECSVCKERHVRLSALYQDSRKPHMGLCKLPYVKPFFCPICDMEFPGSDHLAGVFADDAGAYWLACMVMHYRHHHRSYDRWIGWVEREKGVAYESQKHTINEQAKRQIARKCTDYMRSHGVGLVQVQKLQHTDEKTVALYRRLFDALPMDGTDGEGDDSFFSSRKLFK